MQVRSVFLAILSNKNASSSFQVLGASALLSLKHGTIMSTLKKEWQWCLQQSCREKKKKLDISMRSVWLTPDKCHCQAALCFAMHIWRGGNPSRGILSLSGITLRTTCSSGAMSSTVVMNSAAGLVTLLWERGCGSSYVCFGFFLLNFSILCALPLAFCEEGAWSQARSSSSVSHRS